MAWRIGKSITRGEIDNRLPGTVSGRLWVLGRQDPIELDLRGNCLRDIAGCRVEFKNPNPEPDDRLEGLAGAPGGSVGDMTASRRVRVFDVSVEEALEQQLRGIDVPVRMANGIYLEWFSEANGRVIVETTDFTVKVSTPQWRLGDEELSGQVERSQEAMRGFLELPADAAEMDEDGDGEFPMNEFEWEKMLKESDAKSDKYGDLLEKYIDHPDRETIIAREMGWDWLKDALDAEEKGIIPDRKEDYDHPEAIEPNPRTEGVDWIHVDKGRVKHPLAHRAFEASMAMWHACNDRGLLEDDGDPDVQEMVFQAQTLSDKLVGALNGMASEVQPEAGFIIACLKRALCYVDSATAAGARAQKRNVLPSETLDEFRGEIFKIREEMLRLMQRLRKAV